MRKTKHFLQSKIIWAAAIPMLAELPNLLLENPLLPQKYVGALTLISGALSIVFRVRSKGEKLTGKK